MAGDLVIFLWLMGVLAVAVAFNLGMLWWKPEYTRQVWRDAYPTKAERQARKRNG